MLTKRKKQDKWLTQEQFDALNALEEGVDYHITNAKINYNTEISHKPVLNTNNSAAQTASASETISGTINLHKVAKTGTYSDLISKPTLGTAAAKDAGTQNGVADLDANGKVPVNELPIDAKTGATAPTTSTAADYVGQWYLDTTNSKTYQCTAITSDGGTPPTYTYTWAEMLRAVTSGSGVRVYGINNSNEQTVYYLDTTTNGNTVARRTNDGTVKVATPTATDDATNKNYVDTNFSKLDASNLSSANITSWQSACGFERVENIPLTNNKIVSNSSQTIDLSKYKRVRCYYKCYTSGNGNYTADGGIIEMDTTRTPFCAASQALSYNVFDSGTGWTSHNDMGINIAYSPSDHNFSVRMFYNGTVQTTNTEYYIYKMEGIY